MVVWWFEHCLDGASRPDSDGTHTVLRTPATQLLAATSRRYCDFIALDGSYPGDLSTTCSYFTPILRLPAGRKSR